MAREIINLYPNAVHLQDNDGRFPLHYAAVLKDDDAMYNLLIECGSDETKMDNVSKQFFYLYVLIENFISHLQNFAENETSIVL